MADHGWKVVLIGGASGVGKSVLARAIARASGATLLEADDVRMALQSVTSPVEQPELHFFVREPGVAREGVWRLPPADLVAGLIGVGRVISRALDVVVAHHVARDKPIVLEGDGILPAFAAGMQDSFGTDAVRSVFLAAPDEEFFHRRVDDLPGNPETTEPDDLAVQARVNWRYGNWLTAEATRLGLPVLPALPWATLGERARPTLGLDL